MNKYQIICPLIAMAVAALVVMAAVFKGANRTFLRSQVYRIGQELVATTNSARIEGLEAALKERLSELLGSSSGVAAVWRGDEPPPIGDGRATFRLFLTNATGHRLGIRLRRDSGRSEFRVLGFWNVAKPEPSAAGLRP